MPKRLGPNGLFSCCFYDTAVVFPTVNVPAVDTAQSIRNYYRYVSIDRGRHRGTGFAHAERSLLHLNIAAVRQSLRVAPLRGTPPTCGARGSMAIGGSQTRDAASCRIGWDEQTPSVKTATTKPKTQQQLRYK